MSREYKYDFDLSQPLKCLLLSDAAIPHSTQRSQKRSCLGQQLGRRLGSAATTFAMIGFSEVCQFEIDRERFRHLMCFSNIQTTDDSLRAFDQASLVLNVVCWLRVQLSMLNQQHAQLLDR